MSNQTTLPGPPPTALCLLGAIAFLASAVVLFSLLRTRGKRGGTRAASFAGRGELKTLHIRETDVGRVTSASTTASWSRRSRARR